MASMKFQTRLEEVAQWWDYNKRDARDVVQCQKLQSKLIENFFDLFALASKEFREIKGVQTQLERPPWQALHIPTFVERKPTDPDDPD